MLDETLMPARNVVSLAQVRASRQANAARPLRARICCHCGAVLGDTDIEAECSGAGFGAFMVPARRAAE